MIALYVLGRIEIEAPDANAGHYLLAQPRPTALLAHLAIERPVEFKRRDKLAAMFWPETDQDHARGNLRKLLYALRKALGDDLVESRGDEDVRLRPNALWCDATEFESCLRSANLARAIELYRGPLMPGFFLSGTSEYEAWLDATRDRLSRDAVKAALRLADEHVENEERTAAGDLARFVRQLVFERQDEPQLRKLIELLERTGDHASALAVYERFRLWLQKEYRAIPALETRLLVQRIRGE